MLANGQCEDDSQAVLYEASHSANLPHSRAQPFRLRNPFFFQLTKCKKIS